ncbi:hypothetical protein BY458DRAFT_486323 [Sporodiniella umbellata]|nr:hypothetical protein BY458DRAFT_486323 [Sporodiniella umbellata]
MASGFDKELPDNVYDYNEIRNNIKDWKQSSIASLLKPAPVTQHLPSFDSDGKPCFKPYRGSGKLEGKYALITGADSGIGRSIATLYALEGVAGITIVYRDEREDEDAMYTKNTIEAQSKCQIHLIARDVGYDKNCQEIVDAHMTRFGRLDILVNNAGEGYRADRIEDMVGDTMERTFRTNVFGPLLMSKYASPMLVAGGVIVNTASIAAYFGMSYMVDYSATKGAVVSFTRALAQQLAPRRIRVNAVAPGYIWTPMIPINFTGNGAKTFGNQSALQRPGQPSEIATAFVYLASDDASYMTGQVLHPFGGLFVE